MTAQAEDFEVGLSEASFLWLASADYAKRSTVYEAIRNTIENLSEKRKKRYSPGRTYWAIRNDKVPGVDVALMPGGGKSIYILAIMIDGDQARKAFEAHLKRVRDARAELPKLTSFHLNSVKSPADFSNLLDALTNLADSQIEPFQAPFRHGILHVPMDPEPPVGILEWKTWNRATPTPLSLASMTSKSARRLEAAFHSVLPAEHTTDAPPIPSAQAVEWEPPEGAPSAAEDAIYFFSRRATVAVPALSSGRPPAQPLIK